MARPLPASISEKLPKAAELFAERGFEATRMEDVVEITGVPKATLYYHFEGKEALLVALLSDLLDALAAAVGEALDQRGTALDRLTGAVRAQLEVMAAHPVECQVLLAELGRVGRMPDIAAAVSAAFHEPVQKLLADGRADGSLRKVDEETAASAVFGAVTMTGLHSLVLTGGIDVDRVARTVVALVREGLAVS
ncbi:MAG TPA: TetR/AcrR family transcriptional regulator [Acidimicrobiia bacterium]|nr:TetR/AcrR family transcriptional regulator [Acidimicrobiia bacterium]